jgi:acyl-CoA synthetase (AMP-forming)/AMP-acid ligase II
MPGDRVGMVLPNVLSFPILFYGALMAGATVVPMNPLLKAHEIHYYLLDSGARLVVAAPASAQQAVDAAGRVGVEVVTMDFVQPDGLMGARAGPDPVARTDNDQAAILYTSRTTGPPKGAELTHGIEFEKPDLDPAERFAHDFGFVTATRTADTVYLRGARGRGEVLPGGIHHSRPAVRAASNPQSP